jgi:hypothetical protein
MVKIIPPLLVRLREFTVDRGVPTMPINVHPSCCTEAADEIDRLTAENEKLLAVLKTVRLYIEDQMIAGAVVTPKGQHISGNDPSLLQVVDKAIGLEQAMREER